MEEYNLKCLEVFEDMRNRYRFIQALAYHNLAITVFQSEDSARAEVYFDNSVAMQRLVCTDSPRESNTERLADLIYDQANFYCKIDRWELSKKLLQEAHNIYDNLAVNGSLNGKAKSRKVKLLLEQLKKAMNQNKKY